MCIIDKNIKGAVFCSKTYKKIPRIGLLKFVIVLVNYYGLAFHKK